MANTAPATTKQTTVYGRLQKVRAELSKLNLKKSGSNTFTKAQYFELGDFEPQLNQLCDEQGIMPLFLLEDTKAKLWIINTDAPDQKVLFYSPAVPAEVKGALAIQNLGAQITYMRRYMLMIAFEISDGEIQDAQAPEAIEPLDVIYVDRINAAKTVQELGEIGKVIQKELGNDFRKAIVAEYTRRKKELETANKKENENT